MKLPFPVLLGWLIASACATTHGGQPQTDDQKTLYALGLSIGNGMRGLNILTEELAHVRSGLYAQVKGEPSAVDVATHGSQIPELRAAHQAVKDASPSERPKALYVLGLSTGDSLGAFNVTAEELEYVFAGIHARVRRDPPAVDILTYGPRVEGLLLARQAALASSEKQRGKAYQDKVAQEPGATRTASGLIYIETTAGSGPSPKPEDDVRAHYRGTTIDGKEFESSYKRGAPDSFPLNGVIPCWNEGLQRMKVGGKARLVCPSELAYGDRGAPGIKGGATLVFEVELVDIPRGP